MKMKTITPLLFSALFSLGASAVHAQMSAPADSKSTTQDKGTSPTQPGYGPGMMGGPGMGGDGYGCPGMGYGMHPGMMGYGYGMHPGMMGYGMGPGMMGGYGMGPGMMGPGGRGMADLTPEQRKQIGKLQDETRKKNWELMGQVMDEQARLRDQYDAPKPDSDAVASSQKKINDLQRQMYENANKAHERMEAVLTKEQKEKSWRFWRNW
jgi:Spy/CpxP family protein refolding chaperone